MKNLIKPFRAVRYNLKLFNSPSEFLCLPYDIIDKKQQNEFYRRNPYNVIRLTLGKEFSTDNEEINRYTRAAKYFLQWKKNNILIREKRDSIYFYEQKYNNPFTGQIKIIRGFIALIKLREYEERKILPHEEVFPKPLEDRFNLTIATNTQFSPIYGLYHDKKNVIDNIIDTLLNNNKPLINYKEDKNLHHKFWATDDTVLIKKIQSIMRKKLVYIADGHHRYHTMLKYRQFFRKKYNIPKKIEHPVDFIMMFFVNMDHQGISILPTHRILYNLKEMKLKELLEHIKDYFHLNVYNFYSKQEETKVKERWLNDLTHLGKKMHAFGVYIKNINRYFLLTLKNEDGYLKMTKIKKSKAWKKLDVSIIHTFLIDHILHITKKDVSSQIYIDYTKDYEQALQSVKNGKYQVAIILNPPKPREVVQIANNNEKMPQKTTYFYPKILTGMAIYEMS